MVRPWLLLPTNIWLQERKDLSFSEFFFTKRWGCNHIPRSNKRCFLNGVFQRVVCSDGGHDPQRQKAQDACKKLFSGIIRPSGAVQLCRVLRWRIWKAPFGKHRLEPLGHEVVPLSCTINKWLHKTTLALNMWSFLDVQLWHQAASTATTDPKWPCKRAKCAK